MPVTEPIDETYFRWLCAKVTNPEAIMTPSNSHWKLLRILHHTEYIWIVPNDDNRLADGVELRRFFLRECGLEAEPHWAAEGCSIFEMLVAFAYRAEFQTTDISCSEWFWRFLTNLNLFQFNDATTDGTEYITNILEQFIWRTYLPNGEGGLFPIRYPKRDQRDVEIWYQFCDYLVDQEC